MADSLKNRLSSMFSDGVARKNAIGVRKYPIVRDDDGLSARARAFEHFHNGLRPSQLPGLGVPRTTIYRYYESWKHREVDAQLRTATRIIRQVPELQETLAEMLRLTVEEVSEAFSHRHAFAALNRSIRLHLMRSLDALSRVDARRIDDLGILLSAYRGRDRVRYLIRFSNWCEKTLKDREAPSEIRMAVLRAVQQNGDGLTNLENLIEDVKDVVFRTQRKQEIADDRAEVGDKRAEKGRRRSFRERREHKGRVGERITSQPESSHETQDIPQQRRYLGMASRPNADDCSPVRELVEGLVRLFKTS